MGIFLWRSFVGRDIYRKLARHLDRLPGGYPATASGVELRPANPAMKPLFIQAGEFEIRGVVVGLMRQYGQ